MTIFLRWLLGSYFRIFFRLQIYGQVSQELNRVLIVANHASYFDPPLLGIAYPYPIHFLAAGFTFSFPHFWWVDSGFACASDQTR